MQASANWRAFEFNNIAFRVGDIEGRAFSLCAIARGDRANLDALRLQMAANTRFVEWFHPETEVIQVASVLAWRRAAGTAEFAIDGHEINDRSAGAQLNQANFILAPFHRASERAAVETKHAVEVDNAQDKMVYFADTDHRVREVGGLRLR